MHFTVGQKIALSGVLVLAMIANPLASQLRIAQSLLAQAQAEQTGVNRVGKIIRILELTQKAQAVPLSVGAAEPAGPRVSDQHATEIEALMTAFQQSIASDVVASPDVGALARECQASWMALKRLNLSSSTPTQQTADGYEDLKRQHLHLIDLLLDQSGLILDPKADTNYLIDAALGTLPKLAAQLDDLGLLTIRRVSIEPMTRSRRLDLGGLIQQAVHSADGMEGDFFKAFVADDEAAPALRQLVAQALGDSRAFLSRAMLEIKLDSPASQDPVLLALYAKSLDSNYQLADRAVRQLDLRLSLRIQNLRNSQFGQILSLFVFLGMFGFLAYVIARDFRHARSEEKRLAQQLASAEDLARTGSAETDLMSEGIKWSPGMYRLFDEPPSEEPVPRDWLFERVPSAERELVRTISAGVTAEAPCEFQHRILRRDGSVRTVLHRGMVELDSQGWPRRAITILQDITEQREAEQRISLLANSCEITGLPNRNGLLGQLDEKVWQAHREGRDVALLAIEIDQLGIVTDSMGHEGGDRLLVAVADRFVAVLHGRGLLAHLGSGEYALLLGGDWQDMDTTEATAVGIAKLLCASLTAPVLLGSTEVHVSCGVGLTLCSRDSGQPQKLLHQAQAALSRAHEMGDNEVCIFNPEVHARAASRLALEAALRHALERNEFSLVYQPQLNLASGKVCGAEVLLRWNEPSRGAVSPVEFIPLAEETGLIVEIGDWVLRTACIQYMAWQKGGMQPFRVAVNLSVRQLQQADITWRIQTILIETGMDPKQLGLEITESILVDEDDHVVRVLSGLRAMGIEISLDDFGTGYSNLRYLRKLPIDVVKIDRSIVHDVTAAAHDVSMARAVINMAHGLQMKVLAEGVETEGQLALLMANHCDEMQGYFFSPGLTPGSFEAMMKEGRQLPEHMFKRERQRTLLLVDDEENILAALKRLLRRDGYKIVTATSGAQGLQCLAEHEVDVILSDQRMPGMTGVEFLRGAKEMYPDTVRMVLSGYTEFQSITDAVNEGAIYKFLTKPWDDDRLRAHIAEAFRSKELGDENARLSGKVNAANQELAEVNHRLQSLLASQRDKINREELSLQKVREVLENIPAAIIGVDLEGTVAYLNAEAERVMAGEASLLGNPAETSLPPELRKVWRAGDGRQYRIALGDRNFSAVCKSMVSEEAGQGPRGKLLVMTSADSLIEMG